MLHSTMGKGPRSTFLKRRNADVSWAPERELHTCDHQGHTRREGAGLTPAGVAATTRSKDTECWGADPGPSAHGYGRRLEHPKRGKAEAPQDLAACSGVCEGRRGDLWPSVQLCPASQGAGAT